MGIKKYVLTIAYNEDTEEIEYIQEEIMILCGSMVIWFLMITLMKSH